MTLDELKLAVIEAGLAEVREAYSKPEDLHKLEGAVEGFEACRTLNTPEEFRSALQDANLIADRAADHNMRGEVTIETYWKMRYKALQVEHVFNVLDCHWNTRPYLSGRAIEQYARIVGVKGEDLKQRGNSKGSRRTPGGV